MSEQKDFVGYEYKEITGPDSRVSQYLDCYECFGWQADGNLPAGSRMGQTTIRMKRDRKIVNKMELTRLQRHFEACIRETEALEKSKTSAATIWALVVGIIGTAFMAGATFAVTHEPPLIPLCILLAVPGFLGWILPYFLYRRIAARQAKKLQPVIEAKEEEIYAICEKGHSLL
ncbi:MAG TPA: hypothetical protein IAC82_05365 [Candidatus Merdivicinus intestinigallinarum]|nr:hypothetical protein [Candidatus Merdivicinus intestinigallinarum]